MRPYTSNKVGVLFWGAQGLKMWLFEFLLLDELRAQVPLPSFCLFLSLFFCIFFLSYTHTHTHTHAQLVSLCPTKVRLDRCELTLLNICMQGMHKMWHVYCTLNIIFRLLSHTHFKWLHREGAGRYSQC